MAVDDDTNFSEEKSRDTQVYANDIREWRSHCNQSTNIKETPFDKEIKHLLSSDKCSFVNDKFPNLSSNCDGIYLSFVIILYL
jgi:hypothetical protein